MAEQAWCPECRERVEVEDEAPESQYERRGEVEYLVQYLACGHTNQGPERVVGAAPGAPYAGVPTAPTTRLRDLRAAGPMWPPVDDDPWEH